MANAIDLSKVAIIAAPTKEPRAVIQQSSSIAAIFAPSLTAILRCQQSFSAASLSLFIPAHRLAWRTLFASQIIANQFYVASASFWYHTAVLGAAVWETKTARRLRKKIVFEIFTLILGSSGNQLCLLLFWPGWWVLGLIGLAARLCVW